MKKWLMALALILGLTACSSRWEYDTQKAEKLHSFLIVGNKLYVVGELHDYEFEHQKVNDLNAFLKSPLSAKIKSVHAEFRVKEPTVAGLYSVELNGEALSESERKTAIETFHFSHNPNPSIAYEAEGTLLKLANRDELLQKFRFKQPLEAKVYYYQHKGALQNGVEGVGKLAVATVMLPVAAVLMVPMMVIWGAACAGTTGGC